MGGPANKETQAIELEQLGLGVRWCVSWVEAFIAKPVGVKTILGISVVVLAGGLPLHNHAEMRAVVCATVDQLTRFHCAPFPIPTKQLVIDCSHGLLKVVSFEFKAI